VGGATGGSGTVGVGAVRGAAELPGVMAQLNIHAEAVRGRDDRRRGLMRYIGANTRPEHITNKMGKQSV